MERGEALQRALPAQQTQSAIMRRDFATREELADYLRLEFPSAANRDGAVSPWLGGLKEAEERLSCIQVERYSATRNFLDGFVSRLSPFIRHGVFTLEDVRQYVLSNTPPARAFKFIQELAWRDYWRRLYEIWGDGVWEDREEYKTGFSAGDYSADVPADVLAAETGLACMDGFVTELHATGYLHNHARMWLAAYLVHWRNVRWQAGARWFLTHLLDGDPASNNLSWQWVASTFSAKPYFFNRENLEKYTRGRFCSSCARRNECPFDGDYTSLSRQLFPRAVGQ